MFYNYKNIQKVFENKIKMDYTKAKMDDVIKRINELYKKSKEEGLTESEKEEQKVLRRRYIDGYKASLRAHLETIEPKNKKK